MKVRLTALIIFFLCILCNASFLFAGEPVQMNLSPEKVNIGTFYDGGDITVTGSIPSDCEAVIRMMGEEHTVKMKKKDKVFGLLWMNRETVSFSSVPGTFLLCTSKNLQVLSEKRKEGEVWELGIESLSDRTAIEPDTADRKQLFEEFLKLKKEEGIYAVREGIQYTQTGGEQKNFEVTIPLPSKLAPGNYTIEAYAVRAGKIAGSITKPLTVQLESLPALMANMAFHHSAVYGVLATLIAVIAGLLSGVFFGGAKGGH